MGTDWKLKPRTLRPLTQKTLIQLNLHAGLDQGDRRDARQAAEMHQEIRRALEAYRHQHVWMDRARPANRLRGLAEFKKRLVALVDVFDDLDDVIWRDIDAAHEPGMADHRAESSVRLALDQIREAVASVEHATKSTTKRTSGQHPPTTDPKSASELKRLALFAERLRARQ